MSIVMEPSSPHLSGLEQSFDSDSGGKHRLSRGRAVQHVWPYALSLSIAAASYFFWARSHPLFATFREVLNNVVSLAGAVFGFLLASAAILVGIRESWYLARAKQEGVYSSVVRNLFIAMSWCLAAAVLSIICGYLDFPANRGPFYQAGATAWLFVSVTALCVTIRVLQIFSKLMRLISTE